MGFFKTLLSAGPALNRLAKTCNECLNCIEHYRLTNNFDEIIKAAWLYTYGIQNSLEKWNFNPFSAKIFIPNHQNLGRIPINPAVFIILGYISKEAKEWGREELITEIIEMGSAYFKYDYLCSMELKNRLKP